MSETQNTTNNIAKLVEYSAPFVIADYIDGSNIYLYNVAVSENVTSISILNQNTTDEVVVSITLENTDSYEIPVPPSGTYTGNYASPIVSVDHSGTAPDFTIELRKRSV